MSYAKIFKCPLNTRSCKWRLRCLGCRIRIRQWRLDNIHRRRQKIVRIKKARGCVDCGYNEHPAALHFDHVRGKKKFVISQSVGVSWERVLEEIKKCEVRCANCHAIRTQTQQRRKHQRRWRKLLTGQRRFGKHTR